MVELVVVGCCGWRLVGDDGGGGVGRGSGGVDLDGVHLRVVDELRDAEVVVGLRAGDGFLASSRLGCMIPFTDGRKARPANAGQMKKVVHRSFDFQWSGYTIKRTQRFGRSFERPRFGGVSILRQECLKSCAHQGKLRGRKDIHVSAKAIDADQTHLCKHGGDRGAA
jgi:hypothetical protein